MPAVQVVPDRHVQRGQQQLDASIANVASIQAAAVAEPSSGAMRIREWEVHYPLGRSVAAHDPHVLQMAAPLSFWNSTLSRPAVLLIGIVRS